MALKQRILRAVGNTAWAKQVYKRKSDQCYRFMKRECFTSINTLSILLWSEIHDTGNMALLLKSPCDLQALVFYKNPFNRFFAIFPKRYDMRQKKSALVKIWQGIKDEKIKVFGWGEAVEKRLKLQQTWLKAYCNLISTQNNKHLTAMERAQRALEALPAIEENKSSIHEQAAILESICKVPINVDTCSVAKYHSYINMAKSITQQMKENGK